VLERAVSKVGHYMEHRVIWPDAITITISSHWQNGLHWCVCQQTTPVTH